jgi:hypothetical protein
MQMENVSGVTLLYPEFLYDLKSYSLLFDKFYVYGLSSIDYLDVEECLKGDVEFLKREGILVELPLDVWIEVGREAHASEDYRKLIATFDNATVNAENVAWDHDYFTRLASARMAAKGLETVPICERDFPEKLFGPKVQPTEVVMANTLRIGFNALPTPDETCPWEDVLSFRADMKGKAWEFRRFLCQLATEEMTESQIREEIGYSLSKYREWMEIHRRKSRLIALDAIFTPLKVLEKAVKLKWGEIAEVIVSAEVKRTELLEAELEAPGRECAYVFKAKQEFRTQSETAKRTFKRPPLSWPGGRRYDTE